MSQHLMSGGKRGLPQETLRLTESGLSEEVKWDCRWVVTRIQRHSLQVNDSSALGRLHNAEQEKKIRDCFRFVLSQNSKLQFAELSQNTHRWLVQTKAVSSLLQLEENPAVCQCIWQADVFTVNTLSGMTTANQTGEVVTNAAPFPEEKHGSKIREKRLEQRYGNLAKVNPLLAEAFSPHHHTLYGLFFSKSRLG